MLRADIIAGQLFKVVVISFYHGLPLPLTELLPVGHPLFQVGQRRAISSSLSCLEIREPGILPLLEFKLSLEDRG